MKQTQPQLAPIKFSPNGKAKILSGHKYFLNQDVWHIDTMNTDFWIVFVKDTQIKVKPEELVLVESFMETVRG